MAKKKRPNESNELEWQEKITKLVIIAMFSNDVLMERFVIKGGNALDLIHHVSTRRLWISIYQLMETLRR